MDANSEPGSDPRTDAAAAERRGDSRDSFGGEVTIDLTGIRLSGPGRNVSTSGVYFVAEGNPTVEVRVEGSDHPKIGELVRVESIGSGRLGVAVRFVDEEPGTSGD